MGTEASIRKARRSRSHSRLDPVRSAFHPALYVSGTTTAPRSSSTSRFPQRAALTVSRTVAAPALRLAANSWLSSDAEMESTPIRVDDDDGTCSLDIHRLIDDLASFFADLYAAATPLDLARAVLKAAFDAHNEATELFDAELQAERARLRAASADLSELLAVQAAGASRSPGAAAQPPRAAATPQLGDSEKAPWPSPDASPERPITKLRLLRSSASPARMARRVTVSYPSPVDPAPGARDVRPRSALLSTERGPLLPPTNVSSAGRQAAAPQLSVVQTRSPSPKSSIQGYADSSAIIDAYFPGTPSPQATLPTASSRSRSLTLVSNGVAFELGDPAASSSPPQLSSPLDVVRRPSRDLACTGRPHTRSSAPADTVAMSSPHADDAVAPATPPSHGLEQHWEPAPEKDCTRLHRQRPCSLRLDLPGASSSSADGFDPDGPLTPRPRLPPTPSSGSPPTSRRAPSYTDDLAAAREELEAQRAALETTEAALVRAWDRAEVLADARAEADADLQTVRIELAAVQHVLDGERRLVQREREQTAAQLQAAQDDLLATHAELASSRAELAAVRFELQAALACVHQFEQEPTTPRRHSFAIGEREPPCRTRQRSMKWLGDARAQPALTKIEEEDTADFELDSEISTAHECIAQLEARVERADREGRRMRAELEVALERVAVCEKELNSARGDSDIANSTAQVAETARHACDSQLATAVGVISSLQAAQSQSTEELARERHLSQELTDRVRMLQEELRLRAAELDACSTTLQESFIRIIDGGRLLAEKDAQIAALTADWLAARCDAAHADALLLSLSGHMDGMMGATHLG
ncbi:hypothetical protein AURDEDRAFT_151740 [Auricularia subglabra TFB-10046 SS5]|nr:hypothetical protein AURDEDRAFT_151740 [Auricularia subglabra TFB-10046 SS5]